MTQARKELVSLSHTPYYHCYCRCVRRAYLCGEDQLTGKNYSHRKKWVVNRLAELSEVFTIDICAYAIMSNHYHLVIHIDKNRAKRLSDKEVIMRWSKLFKLPLWMTRFINGEKLSSSENKIVDTFIKKWRTRLRDISWFMRCLNEYLARKANK